MEITAALVKELRERTGVGMMECKKALVKSGGDIEKAIEEMRKAGHAKADNKAGRTAAEGIILIRTTDDNKFGVMLELNTETDFSARESNVQAFGESALNTALENKMDDLEILLASKPAGSSETLEETRKNLIAKVGENIKLRRIQTMSTDGLLGSYIHGGRIGVLVEIKGGNLELVKDIAMQIAASNPIVVKPTDVPEELVIKEREIFTAQAQESGKPAEIIEKMIDGRIKKYLDEVSLVGQPFVKNPDMTVSQLIKNANAEVISFQRFEVGEGIEKKTGDFAAEVMAQVKDVK